MPARVLRHRQELLETAREALVALRELSRYVPRASPVVVEFSVDFDEREFLEGLNNPRALDLLVHLKTAFPELAGVRRWTNLRVEQVTLHLLDGLEACVREGRFPGVCDVCREGY